MDVDVNVSLSPPVIAGPVSVVAWMDCACAPAAPKVGVTDDGWDLMYAKDGYRLWAGPLVAHDGCDRREDYRQYLVSSDMGHIWLVAEEFAFDSFFFSPHPSLSRLFHALYDMGPWFALPERDGVGGEDGAWLVTSWAAYGLTSQQAAALERLDRIPSEFGAWVDEGAKRRWPMRTVVAWARQFEYPSQASRWIDVGFPSAARAAAWDFETDLSADAACNLDFYGLRPKDGDIVAKDVETVLRARVGADPQAFLTAEQRRVRDDAVVLVTLVYGLDVEDAVLCARAGCYEVAEVRDLLRSGSLDRGALEALAALQP